MYCVSNKSGDRLKKKEREREKGKSHVPGNIDAPATAAAIAAAFSLSLRAFTGEKLRDNEETIVSACNE